MIFTHFPPKQFLFQVLVERVSQYVHSHTLYTEYRPFGTAAIIATWDELDGYSLNMVEPSGFFLVKITL